MAKPAPPSKNKSQFASAATPEKKPKKKISPRLMMIGFGAVLAVAILGYFYIQTKTVPPQGNILYGICRVYIERHLQYPYTLKIIEFNQRIPEGEDARAPKKISYDITFSSIDGFGQNMLNTISCDFRLEEKLKNTPWQGLVLERTQMNGRSDHGWADVLYPPERKTPRAADDNSEELEEFNQTLPAIITYPPDLTLPWHKLNKMKIEDLQNL